MSNKVQYQGITYDSVKELCREYNVNYTTFKYRMKRGATVEQAINGTFPRKDRENFSGLKITDHKGNVFESVTAMCRFYGLKPNTYYRRVNLGWSLERVLEEKIPDKPVDHLGNRYDSIKEMCQFWNISTTTYKKYSEMGYSIDEIIRIKSVTDHKGNSFKNIKEMCEYYGITNDIYNNRIHAHGWSLERTLITPVGDKNKKPITDPYGRHFDSVEKLLKYHHIKPSIYYYHKHNGKSLKEIIDNANN